MEKWPISEQEIGQLLVIAAAHMWSHFYPNLFIIFIKTQK